MNKIEHLFKNMHDTVILSCLQGHMGRAWTDDLDNPKGALIQAGTFCFIVGDENSNQVSQLIAQTLDLAGINMAYVITENVVIGDLIEKYYGDNSRKIQRYEINRKKDEFDLVTLQAIVARLPKEYGLSPINEEWYGETLRENWSEDFVSNFSSQEDYIERGIGRIIIHNGKIVSGASSYTIYNGGIEIEIATREEYRKHGLAQIVGAALILACREKGLYPSWDAANMISVRLAQKLGYEFNKPYDTYMIGKTQPIEEYL